MDYLFYGNIDITRKDSITTIVLNISCEPDEVIQPYELSSNSSHHLVYKPIEVKRVSQGISAVFETQTDRLFLFIVSGQSNEIDIPFEATYAVYNGEVIALPENNVLRISGSTYIFRDGERKVIE
jgi:hypothetical protein